MSKRRYPFKKYPGGFSLVEMLIATGIMAIGLVMVATIFPVGMKLTGMSAERSVAAVTADEAFAKVQLYGLRDFQIGPANNWPVTDPNIGCSDYIYTTVYFGPDSTQGTADDPDSTWSEFLYPSAELSLPESHKYHWSALCRRTGENDVQVTVFVTRKSFSGLSYYGYDPTVPDWLTDYSWPVPVKVDLIRADSKTLEIDTAGDWGAVALDFFDDGFTIVDDQTGNIYRILEMKDVYSGGVAGTDGNLDIILYDDWAGDLDSPPAYPVTTQVWVVPPGVGSSRYPCVGVFQRVIRFDEI